MVEQIVKALYALDPIAKEGLIAYTFDVKVMPKKGSILDTVNAMRNGIMTNNGEF